MSGRAFSFCPDARPPGFDAFCRTAGSGDDQDYRAAFPCRFIEELRAAAKSAPSYNFYSAATDYSYRGSHFLALGRMIRSFVLWPLPLPSEDGMISRFLRVKSFIVLILRIFA